MNDLAKIKQKLRGIKSDIQDGPYNPPWTIDDKIEKLCDAVEKLVKYIEKKEDLER